MGAPPPPPPRAQQARTGSEVEPWGPGILILPDQLLEQLGGVTAIRQALTDALVLPDGSPVAVAPLVTSTTAWQATGPNARDHLTGAAGNPAREPTAPGRVRPEDTDDLADQFTDGGFGERRIRRW